MVFFFFLLILPLTVSEFCPPGNFSIFLVTDCFYFGVFIHAVHSLGAQYL